MNWWSRWFYDIHDFDDSDDIDDFVSEICYRDVLAIECNNVRRSSLADSVIRRLSLFGSVFVICCIDFCVNLGIIDATTSVVVDIVVVDDGEIQIWRNPSDMVFIADDDNLGMEDIDAQIVDVRVDLWFNIWFVNVDEYKSCEEFWFSTDVVLYWFDKDVICWYVGRIDVVTVE